MKIKEIIEHINEGIDIWEGTCDTIKIGNEEKEAKKVAVTMIATVDVIRKAKEWGADFLITHEPTFYEHFDTAFDNESQVIEKKKLIEDAGLTLYRWHDHPHNTFLDCIFEGEITYLDLKGEARKTKWGASTLFTLDEPITARELGKRMEEKLCLKHLRIAGELDKKSTRLACCFGTPGGVFDLLRDDDVEIVLTGETIEWCVAEYARDAAALGKNKSLLVMTHIGSERDGMKLLAERMIEELPQIETKYFECEEVYH